MSKRIAIFLPPSPLGMSVMLVKNLCWIAARHAQTHQADPSPTEVVCFSIDGEPVHCVSGGPIHAERSLAQIDTPDAVFLSAFWGDPQTCLEQVSPLLPKLRAWHTQNIPIIGVSNAPFFMAEAGLLDHKVATVYPPVAGDFQQRFPQVQLRSARAITDAGNLYCANGIASGCDLIVSIIEILYGPDVARRMTQDFLLGFQRSYSLANLEFDGQKYHTDHQIMTAQHWLERNFTEQISLETVAADRGMSPRNFSRRFKQATGDSPSHYLQRVRIEMAKELLSTSDKQVAAIAFEVGYTDSSYFSRIFKKIVGCLPNAFRQSS